MINPHNLTTAKQFSYYILYYLLSRLGIKKPLLGGIKLSNACNLSCCHCPFWRKPTKPFTFSQARSALRMLFRRGVRIVIIEGGEPFLWKDDEYTVEDLVAEAQKLFFFVGVTTNGTFPIVTNAQAVWVSIDGLESTHNQLRSDSFSTVIQNIEASTHPKIYGHITINKKNVQEIETLITTLSPKVAGISIQFHYPYNEGEDDLTLPWGKRESLCDQLILMKQRGYPLINSVAALKALKRNQWTCRPWMVASVDPERGYSQGCYVKNRGTLNCNLCGFSAHTELSLAYNGALSAILLGQTIFGPTRTMM